MQYIRTIFIVVFVAIVINSGAQQALVNALGSGSDFMMNDSLGSSMRLVEKEFADQTEVVFCPAGIQRSSQDDRKKRYVFDWVSKYNNIYLKSRDKLVYEGMNEHGFSASLLFLDECKLPQKEKELIPIAASLAVNFFIDHFKCVDTALLAVWDIRIYDDKEQGWPFRIVLHDSTGATAYVEYINGGRQVYTPDDPAFVVAGPDYTHQIKLGYIPDETPVSNIEKLYLDLFNTGFPPNASLLLMQYYMKYFGNTEYYTFFRYHLEKEMVILTPGNDEAVFKFSEAEFIPGKEVSLKFF